MPEVIASVVELRQRRLQEQGIILELHEEGSHLVRAIFAELQQVLLNFVTNAEQAIVAARPARRRIVIRTADVDERLRVEVEDSGPGVAPENESKLFQPFFTTKPVGEGTGLGLSVSYGIIQSLGGEIGYRRAAAGGALFYVELPAHQPGPRA
jgi:C4-dicarboxylate-specific signal transduction histidine kinase